MMLSLLDWASLKMKRLEKSGASLVTPSLGVSELKAALNALGVREKFDDKAVSDIYFKISAVIGVWRDDLNAQDASETAKAFLSTARNLEKASTLLSGRQTGIRTSVETYVTNETIRLLALDPTVRDAERTVDAFREQATKIAHACMVAYVELAENGARGRPKLGWYDDFTKLLIAIASRGGIKPTIGRDRVTHERTGWLLDAAEALEPFLEPYMRSQSREARAKRIERSKRRLRFEKRQKPPRG
jgi:hypothetical protein